MTEVLQNIVSREESSVASREITFFHQAVIKVKNRDKTLFNSIGYIPRSGLRREVGYLYKLLICRVKIHLSKVVLYLNYSLT